MTELSHAGISSKFIPEISLQKIDSDSIKLQSRKSSTHRENIYRKKSASVSGSSSLSVHIPVVGPSRQRGESREICCQTEDSKDDYSWGEEDSVVVTSEVSHRVEKDREKNTRERDREKLSGVLRRISTGQRTCDISLRTDFEIVGEGLDTPDNKVSTILYVHLENFSTTSCMLRIAFHLSSNFFFFMTFSINFLSFSS